MLTNLQMKEKAAQIRGSFSMARMEIENEQAILARLRKAQQDIETLVATISEAAQAAQMRFGVVIAGVVTECLNSVYPDNPYVFKLEFRECAGKTVVDTLLYREGEALDPMASTGGGVWDVLAFALRVAIFILTAGDDTRKFMAFDEPFKFLHGAAKIRRAYETMESVRAQFGLTIFCVRQH